MTRSELLGLLADASDDKVVMLEGEEFDGGAVGTALVDDRVRLVYDVDLLCKSLVDHGSAESYEDALDMISYDTMSAISNVDGAPIIVKMFDIL